MSCKRIGVLALQGAVAEHIAALESQGAAGIPVKHPAETVRLDGLIIPGGESTAIGKLIEGYGFLPVLSEFARKKPIFGTCAGMVLLAQNGLLHMMDIEVRRNAFGRQRESFETDLQIKDWNPPYPAVFIRAPLVASAGPAVEVLARVEGHPVLVRQDNLLAASFHPELTGDNRLLQYFLTIVDETALDGNRESDC